MMKKIAILSCTLALAGCASTPPEWITGSNNCKQMGCGKDLEFYPMAPGEADRNARAHGFEWGKTSSAHAPGTAEYERLRREEAAQGNTPWHWNQRR